jgi:hypothetical protein
VTRSPKLALALALLAAGLLTASRCYDKNAYEPTAPGTVDALTLTTADGSTSLPADGVSRLVLVARLSPDSAPDRRTVVFSASAGTLIGGAAGTGGARTVDADATGTAVIQLQSAQQVETAEVTASVEQVPGLTKRLLIDFIVADPNDVVRFVAAPAHAPADGATLSTFRVQVSAALPAGSMVSFAALPGAFAPENTSPVSRPVDGSNTAAADLVSPSTLGSGRVTATANNVTREVSIQFDRALPNLITVSTQGKFQVKADNVDTATVVGTFLRDIGQVTEGTVATFRATDDAGQSVGFFRDVGTVSGPTGRQATATFLAGDTTYRGRVTITVGADGSSVIGTADVEIVDP